MDWPPSIGIAPLCWASGTLWLAPISSAASLLPGGGRVPLGCSPLSRGALFRGRASIFPGGPVPRCTLYTPPPGRSQPWSVPLSYRAGLHRFRSDGNFSSPSSSWHRRLPTPWGLPHRAVFHWDSVCVNRAPGCRSHAFFALREQVDWVRSDRSTGCCTPPPRTTGADRQHSPRPGY